MQILTSLLVGGTVWWDQMGKDNLTANEIKGKVMFLFKFVDKFKTFDHSNECHQSVIKN